MASRFPCCKLLIRDCLPEQSQFDPPTPKHKVLARRLKSRISSWRLVPKIPKRRALASCGSLGNIGGCDKAAVKQDFGRSNTVSYFSKLGKFRHHRNTLSTSSDETKLDTLSQILATNSQQPDDTDPFVEENLLNTSLDAFLLLLPDGSSTPRRCSSIQRQSALPCGLDLSKKTESSSPLAKSNPSHGRSMRHQPKHGQNSVTPELLIQGIPQHTSSKVREDNGLRVTNGQIQYKKHPSPSKKTLQSLKACCQDITVLPRTTTSDPKSSTVQEFSTDMDDLYGATTVSQKRRSTPARKTKLIHLRAKSSRLAVDSPPEVTGEADSKHKRIIESQSESMLAARPPPVMVLIQHPRYYADPNFGDTTTPERPLQLRSDNLQKIPMLPPPRYTLSISDELTKPPPAPSLFARQKQSVRTVYNKENFVPKSPETKKHPSPTEAEWEILGSRWKTEMDRIGFRADGR